MEGKRWDASASVTVGAGVSVGVNVGYGETEGSSAWVDEQTSIVGSESVNIKVGGHTQIDGALIANIKEDGTDGGNLVLDTGTLGYTNLKDHHEETSSYLSIGINTGGNSSTNESDKDGSWSVSGSFSDLDRKQETNATVGQGVVRVRNDEETGADSTAGLNRDIDTAQVVTKDKETGFDLYVSSTAIDSIEGLFQKDENGNNKTLSRWADNITSVFDPQAYAQMFENVNQLLDTDNIEKGWEEAKATLGIREVKLPDSGNLQSSVESSLTQKQQDQLALLGQDIPANAEALAVDPDGNIIGYRENDQPTLLAPELLAERKESAEKLIGLVAQGDALLRDIAAFDEQLNQTGKDRFIAGYDASANSRYELDKSLAGSVSNGDISNWSVTMGAAEYDSIYGSPAGTALGQLGQVGGSIVGGFAHLAYDSTTDWMGAALTGAYLYSNPAGGISGLLSGNTPGGKFATDAQNWADNYVSSFGPGSVTGGFGNEGMKDGFEIGLFATSLLSAGGVNAGSKVVRMGEDAKNSADLISGASLPLGSKRLQFNQPKNPAYQPLRNEATHIDGVDYSGHAIDRMQDRGLMPSVVQNTIETGIPKPSYGNTTVYSDPVNKVKVVVNSDGKVVTAEYGD